jgi:hypothetical protein
MSTHAYYKDRLGFEPDGFQDGHVNHGPGPIKSRGYEESLSKFKGEEEKKAFSTNAVGGKGAF